MVWKLGQLIVGTEQKTVQAQLDSKQARIGELEARVSMSTVEITRLKTEADNSQQNHTASEASLRQQMEKKQARIAELETGISGYDRDMVNLKASMEELQEKLKGKNTEAGRLESDIKQTHKCVRELEKELEKEMASSGAAKEEVKQQMNNHIKDLESKVTSLKGTKEQAEAYKKTAEEHSTACLFSSASLMS
ncbi:hypothetical protein VKT23_020356 [Stygiomarasmius scandens]|uniref:Myosin heavy chain n=1 Tax=Marasmiellus scandens TaxID=2682957 RepID=A0ABR1ILS2_9AGAR